MPHASRGVAPRTILHRFFEQVDRLGPRPALRHRTAAGWEAVTWSAYGEAVLDVAAGLADLGVGPGDRVAILSDNRVEWHVADLATMALGAVTVPIYQTSAPVQLVHVLNDSGAVALVVDSFDQLAKVHTVRGEVPALRAVVAMDVDDDGGADTWAALRARGALRRRGHERWRAELLDALRPEAPATLVYTSGTTGAPKGAVLTHANLAFTAHAVTSVVPVSPRDRFVSFLPLSHIAERVVSHFGQIVGGAETWFARSLATVAEDLHECRPTLFFAVPRIWEKLHEAILDQFSRRTGVEAAALRRYLAVRAGGPEWHVLDLVVGRTVRRKLGLDRARVLSSGAAPIDPALLRWFASIGLPIGEAYGQTEDCGPATLNPPHRVRFGTVGPPLPGVEVRIADDGEVLVRGPSVCAGYWGNPAATAELIGPDGWMHTGDLGAFDEAGYLRITGRRKDLIITAGGQNVAPQPIEVRLQSEQLVGHAVVVGDRMPYLTALVTLDGQQLAAWAERHHKLFAPEALARDPDVHAEVQAAIDRVNAEHARVEQIRRFRILPAELTLAAGELTPTLKVRRAAVLAHYADEVAELYAAV